MPIAKSNSALQEERSVVNRPEFFGQFRTVTLPAQDAGGGHRHGPTPPL